MKTSTTTLAVIGTCFFALAGGSFADGADLDSTKGPAGTRQVAQNARRAKELALVSDIYRRIVAASKEPSEAGMKVYTDIIQGTNVSFVMVPIEGGEFVMGSPASEPGRQSDESPPHRVKLSAFWMQQPLREQGKTEPIIGCIWDSIWGRIASTQSN